MKMTYFQPSPCKVSLEPGEKFAYCTCGFSEEMPCCNGSHRGTEFKPIKWTSEEYKEIWLCRCGRSLNKPYCDGSHREV